MPTIPLQSYQLEREEGGARFQISKELDETCYNLVRLNNFNNRLIFLFSIKKIVSHIYICHS